MENEKRNRYIIVSIIVVLLLIVLGFAVYAIILRNKKDNNLINVTINQLYSSDYKLDNFSDSSLFFILSKPSLIRVFKELTCCP